MNEGYIDDMIFGGSPITKLLDVLKHANANLTEAEFEKFIYKVATLEAVLDSKGVSDGELMAFARENEDMIRDTAYSLAITVTADILTQNE
jgi:hypothetical protein